MKSTSPDISIFFGQGSPLKDISDLVLSELNLGPEGIFVDTTPYRATGTRNSPVGVADQPDLPIDMLFDDDDEASMDLFGTISSVNTPAYTLHVIWTTGSPASSTTWQCHIKDAKIVGKVKDATRMRVVLTTAGPCVHSRQGA